jgi:hypothetical protein
MWKVRNKMAIEKQIVKSHKIIFFNIITVLQQWSVLLSAQEKDRVAGIAKNISKKLAAWGKLKLWWLGLVQLVLVVY